jgi:PTH1 family peptidyl-tRNA hydrolase
MIPDPLAGTSPDLAGIDQEGPRLLVGLGNPGNEYAGTRHNVGFAALDLLAERIGVQFDVLLSGGKRLGRFALSSDGKFALLLPTTFMNLSGSAVSQALLQLEADPHSLFVLTDDFHLPLGALRIRASGSSGGHNGLRSIEDYLGTSDFSRLRIGVGDPGEDSVDFVLSTFRCSEQPVIQETLETASFAAEDWVRGTSIEDLSARFNRRSP